MTEGVYAKTDAAFERAADDFMQANGFTDPEPGWLRDAMRTVGALTMVPLIAEIERLTRQTEGGEWITLRGHMRRTDKGEAWCSCTSLRHAYEPTATRRQWLGPVEPVTDDGSAT